jgi:hypothetical protein
MLYSHPMGEQTTTVVPIISELKDHELSAEQSLSFIQPEYQQRDII